MSKKQKAESYPQITQITQNKAQKAEGTRHKAEQERQVGLCYCLSFLIGVICVIRGFDCGVVFQAITVNARCRQQSRGT